jgi:hypothetical protein
VIEHPLFRAQNLDQLVEDLSQVSENRGLRPLNFDPSMRALRSSGLSAAGSSARRSTTCMNSAVLPTLPLCGAIKQAGNIDACQLNNTVTRHASKQGKSRVILPPA